MDEEIRSSTSQKAICSGDLGCASCRDTTLSRACLALFVLMKRATMMM